MPSNPFKFGTIVDGPYFTDREEEAVKILSILNSENHLILTGPRRYGKTSLVRKVTVETGRPVLYLDMQVITTREDFAAQLLKRVYRLFPVEKLKNYLRSFRIIPTITMNPITGEVDVAFRPESQGPAPLEDVLNLLDKLSSQKNRLIVVLDEFQDIFRIHSELDRNLRSVMQYHKNINYIFLGSRESLIREIFEKKKAPFYHFGYLMQVDKIPGNKFSLYLQNGFRDVCNEYITLAEGILAVTQMHPYYTQQLAFAVWEILMKSGYTENIAEQASLEIMQNHDLDYERLWNTFNRTDMKILIGMADSDLTPLSDEFSRRYNTGATSTVFSSLQRLTQNGILIKSGTGYSMDDPFFRKWIVTKRAL